MAELRKCIGSERYGIEPHEAPVDQFPKQPSQKDGLGRMCKPHWNQYTAGLARDRKARQADEGKAATPAKVATKAERRRTPMTNAPAARAAKAAAKGESPSVTARRQAFEKRLERVGPGSEEGQRMLEQAAKAKREVVSEIRELAS